MWHSWYGSKSLSYSCLNPVITPWLCPAVGCHFPVPLNSYINCLCKFCFTNSAWIRGCWSTLHTPQGGAILRLINFKSWRDCNLVSQTLRKLQRRKVHLELLSSLHMAFLSSPCQHTASLLLAKGSLTWWLQCKRTVFITAQENAANLQITSHYLLYIHLFSPGQNQ